MTAGSGRLAEALARPARFDPRRLLACFGEVSRNIRERRRSRQPDYERPIGVTLNDRHARPLVRTELFIASVGSMADQRVKGFCPRHIVTLNEVKPDAVAFEQ